MRDRITEEHFRQVYRDNIDKLYAFASRRCEGRREMAEDITQETWFRAMRDWRRNGLPDNPIGWLTTVARNLIHNVHRRPEALPLDLVSPADILAAVEKNTVADSSEIAALVSEALARLTPAEAQLLESFHYDRFKMAQLAATHGVSERTIEGRLRRARKRLRHELEITLKTLRGIA